MPYAALVAAADLAAAVNAGVTVATALQGPTSTALPARTACVPRGFLIADMSRWAEIASATPLRQTSMQDIRTCRTHHHAIRLPASGPAD